MSIVRIDWDTSTGRETLRNVVRTTYNTTEREAVVEWKELFKDEKTEDYDTVVQRLAGLGAMTRTYEGQNYHIDTPKYGSTKTYTQIKFTNGFRITEEMQKFNRIGLMKTLTSSLAQTMQEGKDIELAKMWNNVSSTTYAAGFDTLAIASASHTLLDDAGTTYDNYLAGDLTVANIESALFYFDNAYDDQGNQFPHIPGMLYVNPYLRMKAYKILKSDNQALEMSNTINAFKQYDLKPFIYHRLSSSTAWGMLGQKSNKNFGPVVYTSQEPELRTKDAPDSTRDIIVTSGQMFIYGCPDPRLVYVGNI
ncbi:MAG: hypothetical protein WC998_09175 [Candidatus Paceibacterota bacterium]|jgi:hypothetical protein